MNIQKKILTYSVIALAAISAQSMANQVAEAPLVSIKTQNDFFNKIKQHCGKAFEGKVTIDNAKGDSFANKKLVMHENVQTHNCKFLFTLEKIHLEHG